MVLSDIHSIHNDIEFIYVNFVHSLEGIIRSILAVCVYVWAVVFKQQSVQSLKVTYLTENIISKYHWDKKWFDGFFFHVGGEKLQDETRDYFYLDSMTRIILLDSGCNLHVLFSLLLRILLTLNLNDFVDMKISIFVVKSINLIHLRFEFIKTKVSDLFL